MRRSDVRTPGVALECAKACQAVKVPPVSKSICIPSLEYALNLAEAFTYQQKLKSREWRWERFVYLEVVQAAWYPAK